MTPQPVEEARQKEEEEESITEEEGGMLLPDRLGRHKTFWEEIGASATVLRWIKEGYDIPFLGIEPKPWSERNGKGAKLYEGFLWKALPELLNVGAIREVVGKPWGVSGIDVVPKTTPGKFRLILDLRHLNTFLREFKFRMETLHRRRRGFRRGDWLFSIDLESGYYHIPIKEEHCKFLGFQWGGKFYEFRVLPFGLSSAPFAFTKVMKQLANFWRTDGIRLMVYLDDWCFMAESVEEAERLVTLITAQMKKAGLLINAGKSVLKPQQRLKLLGFWIDTVEGSFRIPEERIAKILSHLQDLAQPGATSGARELAGTAGRIQSCYLALGPATRFFTRHMYSCIEERSSWRGTVSISEGAQTEAKVWLKSLRSWDGCAIWPKSLMDPIILRVDASDTGWGGWREGVRQFMAHEYFTPEEAATSSTHREMLGLERLLHVLVKQSLPPSAHVLAYTDSENTQVISEKGSPKPDLNEIAVRVFMFSLDHAIFLKVRWLPRELNEWADYMSKVQGSDDWYLHKDWFHHFDQMWGPHSVDRMANASNAHVSVYNSKWSDRTTAAVNCFTQDWKGENNWVCPGFHLVEAVMEHLRECKATATVVVPVWKTEPWWSTVCRAGKWTTAVLDSQTLPRLQSVFVPEHENAVLGVWQHDFDVVALRVSFAAGL